MKYLGKIALVIFLAIPLLVNAQKTLRIGHIDSDELLSLLPESDSAQKVLEKETKSIRDQLELMQVEFNRKYNDYITKADSLSKFIRQSKEEELQVIQQRIQTFEGNAQQSIQQMQSELFQPIIEKAQKAIQEVAKENNFTYILDLGSGTVLFHSEDSEDIMPLVKLKLGLK